MFYYFRSVSLPKITGYNEAVSSWFIPGCTPLSGSSDRLFISAICSVEKKSYLFHFSYERNGFNNGMSPRSAPLLQQLSNWDTRFSETFLLSWTRLCLTHSKRDYTKVNLKSFVPLRSGALGFFLPNRRRGFAFSSFIEMYKNPSKNIYFIFFASCSLN